MNSLTIGIVAEGPTDIALIKAIISKILPGNHRFLTLQPDISATEGLGSFGGGWKGVISWCQSIPKDFNGIVSFMKNNSPIMDMLIIHLDADVAREPEINCPVYFPDVKGIAKDIENSIRQWLQIDNFPHEIVCCIPCDNTEAWVLCAFDPETTLHNPPDKLLECVEKPDYVISNPRYDRPHPLIKRKDGKPKKTVKVYNNELIPNVLEHWEDVKRVCSQADEFEVRVKLYRE